MRSVYIETYGCQMNLADTELMLGHLGAARLPAHRRSRPAPTSSCSTPAPSASTPRSASSAASATWRATRRGGPDVQLGAGRLHGAAPARHACSSAAAVRRLRRRPRRLPPPAGAARHPPATRSSTCASIATRPTPTSRRSATAACAPGSRSCAAATSSAPSASCPTCAAASAACRPTRSSPRCAQLAARGLPRGRLPRPDGERLPRRRHRLRRAAARAPTRSTASSASASPRRTRRDMSDARHRGDGDLPQGLPAAAPAGAVGLRPRARADGARLHGRRSICDLVERLRAAIPGIALTTDIIVGFPGESEARLRRHAAS